VFLGVTKTRHVIRENPGHSTTEGGFFRQVTVFGESAGAIMSSILFLNSGIEKFARGAVSPYCFFYTVSSDYQV